MRERGMLRRDVCNAAKLFVCMVCIEAVSCELPSQQVSTMTAIYQIIRNNTASFSSFAWSNFSRNSNPCLWKGVGCRAGHSSIININFSRFEISTSEFLPFVCNITTLESLDVSYNDMGSIPYGFLSGCGNISGLKYLDFSWNQLYGPLPSFNGFKTLRRLYLGWNSLLGEIDLQFEGLISLRTLDLSYNSFTGRVPTNLGNTTLLEELMIYGNSFTGSIPKEWAKLTTLKRLSLSSNCLNGSIPTWLPNVTTLVKFEADYNQFSGAIPSGITSHLTSLTLRGSMLEGAMPSDLLSGPHLEEVDLSNNDLEGAIPVVNSTALYWLDLGDNDLNGTVPWDSFGNLRSLVLSKNRLTGSLPPFLGNCTRLQTLLLDSNDFVGEIPSEISQLNLLTEMMVSWNLLDGSIPCSISEMLSIRYLEMEGNNLHGPIPDSIRNLSSLTELHLQNNQLSGIIPVNLSNLQSVTYLNLQNNRLSGLIPDSIRNLSSLTELHLENNQLSGRIPDMPEFLRSTLNLSFNHFDGQIPLSLSRLVKLQVLDLQGNNLGGPLPNNIRNLSSLMVLQLGNNQLSGRIPYMPESIGKTLNLSNNLFAGPIPDTLSNLWQLGVLDLSNNRFSGKIPDFLTRLSSLTRLLLMNNNLSGVVPMFRDEVEVDTRGNNVVAGSVENPSPEIPHREKKSDHTDFGVAAASGVPVGLLISIIIVFISRRYNTVHGYLSPPNTIHTPTVNFKKAMKSVSDPSNIVLKGRFSTFYKAVMPSGTTYLVKKFNHNNYNIFTFPRYKEIVEELEVLGELCNQNVMTPVAYVLTVRTTYLVYNFVRGTLYDMLHQRNGTRFDWASRFTIAIGVSKGLSFLHECSSGSIVLLDLCSKSILLKSQEEPLISDIELCNLIHPSKSRRGGSVGYVPPEYGSTKKVTAIGNVYSFGVVLLELVTGKPAVSEGTELAKWVLSIGNKWDEILDSSISETSVAVRNQMEAVLEVALSCISKSPEMRPNSGTVEQMLLSRRSNN